jgi:hypothetical protein
MNQPRITVVATSRNDDHGVRPLDRMQLFVDGLADQAGRMRLPLELLVVEWNPPPNRPPLAAALRWQHGPNFEPRIVTVPPDVHRELPHSEALPLFQMLAKNVGIRRARAPFVLATNIDVLLTDELFAYLTTSLRDNAMYRVDRRDVEVRWEENPTPAAVRGMSPIREHGLEGTRVLGGRGTVTAAPARGVPSVPRIASAVLDRIVLPKLHTNACGDFTLASRRVWDAIRGYPEWPYFSWHLDGLPLYQAHALGVEMVNLAEPLAAIHLEHSAGWTPEGAKALFDRLDRAGVPYLDTPEYHRLARKVVRAGRAAEPFNGPEWGLAACDLMSTIA